MGNANKLDNINRWLTLGANIGVVLGLIILIVEVRQNAALTRAELEADKNKFLADIEFSLSTPEAANAWTKSVRAPETMTDADIRMVEGHLVALMLQWDQLIEMEGSGLASRQRVERHIRNIAPYYFGSAYAKNWWRLQAPGWEGTPMAEVAGPIVESLDEKFMENYLDASRIEVRPSTRQKPDEQVAQIDAVAASPEIFTVLLENDHVRVLEYALRPGEHDRPHTHPPKLMYVLEGGRLQITPDGEAPFISDEEAGHASWSPARALHTAENVGESNVRILLVEPKSAQESAN